MRKYFMGIIFGLFALLLLPGVISAHTIHFETFGGGSIPDLTVEDGEGIGLYLYEPKLDGYFFDGWTTNSDFSYSGGYEAWPGDYYWNVEKDMTFYAYYYAGIYVHAYNKTLGLEDNFAGNAVIYDEDDHDYYDIPGGYEWVEPYNEKDNRGTFKAVANPGFRFVEWRIAYSMPTRDQLKNGYDGVDYSKTASVSSNEEYTVVGGNGFVTLYAVFEEDPNSTIKLITEARAVIVEPKNGETAPEGYVGSLEVSDSSKYTAEATCWGYVNNSKCVNGKFEYGNDYEIETSFKAKDGYRFGANTEFYINNKKVSRVDTDDFGISNSNTYVTYRLSLIDPDMPNKAQITVNSDGSTAYVNWQFQNIVSKYIVYMSTDNKTWKNTESADATSFEVLNLKNGTTYYFKVKACSATKCSDYSNTASVKIVLKANPMVAKATNKTVKYKTVKKKNVVVSALSVKNAKGTLSYAKISGKKNFTVNKKTGKITVKKKTKKGTYKVKVKVTAKGTTYYDSKSKTLTIKIKVK